MKNIKMYSPINVIHTNHPPMNQKTDNTKRTKPSFLTTVNSSTVKETLYLHLTLFIITYSYCFLIYSTNLFYLQQPLLFSCVKAKPTSSNPIESCLSTVSTCF